MIGIVDYGVGNLFSLKSSFQSLCIETEVSGDPDIIRSWDKIILPGVGAFGDAADKLRAHGLVDVLREEAAKGKPFMGICLGMQLLLEKGYEYGEHDGLGQPCPVVTASRPEEERFIGGLFTLSEGSCNVKFTDSNGAVLEDRDIPLGAN